MSSHRRTSRTVAPPRRVRPAAVIGMRLAGLGILMAVGLAGRVSAAQSTAASTDSGAAVTSSSEATRAGPRLSQSRIGPGAVRKREAAGAGPIDQQRPRAVEYSEWYYRRQAIHRFASFVTVPLFVAQYLAGEELLRHRETASSWARDAHPALAATIQTLFVVNTVTGAWNWWDTRGESAGRVQRTLHAAAMLAADIGFATLGEAEDDGEGEGGGSGNGLQQHRRHAIVSMSVATAGYLLMALPFWRN